MEEIKPGYYTIEAVYDKRIIGDKGYGVILAYHGNENKDYEYLMEHIISSKKLSFNTKEDAKLFLENLLDDGIKILNRESTKEFLRNM